MFEETQKCSNASSWSDPAIEATPQTGSFASTQMPDEPETKFELPSISELKVGIFTKGLQQLLEDQRLTKNTVEGCYASEENFSESLQPDVYTIFQSVLHDIFPWTVTFSTSNTTDKSLKVVLTRPNITKGVQIPRGKEITFLLPLNMPNATNGICHFSVHIMGNKVDYGELPQFIFQPSIFKTALHKILKTIDDLPVCPVNDPAIIDILAERKELTSLYQVDSQSSIADGKIIIVKCIRSTKCSYIIPNESKVRCHECQGFLRSHRCLKKHPSPESTQSKTRQLMTPMLTSANYLVLNSLPGQKIYTKWLPKTKERQDDTTFCTREKNKKKLKHPKITTQHPLALDN